MRGEFAGRLSERVTIELWQDAHDELGGATGAWVEQAEGWAAIQAAALAPGKEADARSSRQRYRITMRPEPRLTMLHRLLWGQIVLTIIGIEIGPESRDRQTVIGEVRL